MARLFCGIVALDGEEIDGQIEQMASNLNFGNLYNVNSYKSKHVSTVHLYSEGVIATQSDFVKKMKPTVTIVSSSMLIERRGLMKKLNMSVLSEIPSDEELILRSYLKWGESCVDFLDGDWAFSIWNENIQSFFMARNQHGDGTLYYYYDGGSKIYFASLITGLIGIPNLHQRKNHKKFFMECMKLSGVDDKTLFEDRYLLLPAHYGVFNASGLKLRQFWDINELPTIIYKNESDYFESLMEIFSNAVKARISVYDEWTSTQSDGLDSAALNAVICNDILPKNGQLKAFSYIPTLIDNSISTENRSVIEEMSKAFPSLRIKYITRLSGLFDYIDLYTSTYGLPPYTINSWYANALSIAIKQEGYNQCFMAQGGNNTISYTGVSSLTNLKQFRQDINDGLDISRIFDNKKYFLSDIKLIMKKRVRDKLFIKTKIDAILSTKTIFDQEFLEEVNAREILENHFIEKNKGLIEGKKHFRNKLNPGMHDRLGMWNMIGAKYDLLYSDPTRDLKLIEYCASLPNHVFNRMGTQKYLYKNTFKKHVPKRISAHDRKRETIPDLAYLYKIDIDRFEDLLHNSKNEYSSIINRKQLIDFHKKLRGENKISSNSYNKIKDYMSIVCMTLFGE